MEPGSETPKVHFKCSECGKALAASAANVGRKVRCPDCQTVLMVPAAGGEQQAPAVRAASQSGFSQPKVAPAPGASGSGAQVVHPSASAMRTQAAPPASPQAHEAEAGQEEVQAPSALPAGEVRRPGISGTRRPAASSPRQRATGEGRFQERRAPKASSKVPILVGAAGIVLAIGFFVFLTISKQMEVAAQIKQTDGLVQQAAAKMDEGEIEEAAKKAKAAEQLVNSLTQDAEAAKLTAWREALKKVADQKARFDEIDELMEQSKVKPGQIREQLERKRMLLADESGASMALQRKIDEALVQVSELERQALLAALRKEMDEANQIYRGGEIDAAIQKANDIRTKLAANDKLKDDALEQRITALRLLGGKYEEAKRVAQRAKGDFDAALQKLDEFAQGLDAASADHKPILAQLTKLKAQIEDEKKKFKRLNPEDLDKLNRAAQNLARRDPGIAVGAKNPAGGVSLQYNGASMTLGLERTEGKEQMVLEAGGERFTVAEDLLTKRPGAAIRMVQTLGDAMQKAGVPPGSSWEVISEAPLASAKRKAEDKIQIFCEDRVYTGTGHEHAKADDEATRALEQAGEALTKAVENDAQVSEEQRRVVAYLLNGTYKELKQNDYLPSEFCRQVVYDGYVESNIAGSEQRYKNELAAYRKAYDEYVRMRTGFEGVGATGESLLFKLNYDDHLVFRRQYKNPDRTSFAVKNPSTEERPLLFVVSEYEGIHETVPAGVDPVKVSMTHPALGVVATFDVKAGTLAYDKPRWAQAAAMTTYPNAPDWMGQPDWAFPPHVVFVDAVGRSRAIGTEKGRVDLPSFSKIVQADERKKAQEAYLDQLAKVLYTTGHLHLYFLYFHQYVLDSPLEEATGLLGCSAHCGDIHQDVYQSLNREMGGRFLGDCDDLAEMYVNLTRRQGKLSFVMAVPGHATCGWVEPKAAGNGYVMQFLDTGPPRYIEADTLDQVVELGSRTYDRDKTMRFDPKSLGYLFRFAGEPTRTPYYLSTRMFTDREYAEVMERVQSYWHFHFYALGIQTMEERIAKGDAVPENCTELAGLYGRVHEFEKANGWTRKALEQLKADEVLTKFNEEFRIALNLHEAKQDDKSFDTIKNSVEELKRYKFGTEEWMRTISSRLSLAGLLDSIGRPWEAYELLQTDANVFMRSQRMRLDHAGALTNILDEMYKQIRNGKQLTDREKRLTDELDNLLNAFYRYMVFRKEDDFGDQQRNYAYIGLYYAAKQGHVKLREELLKDGPWPEGDPDPAGRSRQPNPEEDWKWIRVSMWSYIFEIGQALDPDKDPSEWRKDDAIALTKAMLRGAEHARKRGSLASGEYYLLTARLTHGFLTKDWNEVKEVLQVTEQKDFARLTATVAESFGQAARFVTPEEFVAQYKVFCQHIKERPPFFNAVYEAYRSGAFEHARLTAMIALEHWKHDPLMRENGEREVKFLEQLVEQRKKEAASKK